MALDPRVLDLLARYEALCDEGHEPTLQDLCRDCPELVEPVRQELAGLAALNAALASEGDTLQRPGGQAEWTSALTIPGYELLETVGRGGMGIVHRAWQLRPRRVVALKMILAADLAGVTALKRFLGEAEAIAQLEHPNIVRIYEIGEHQGRPYFTMEYLAGGTLNQRLAGTPLAAPAAAALVECLARAVHTAHAHGIVHRDLKPANVLFAAASARSDDEADTIDLRSLRTKIADFGLAKRLTVDSELTTPGAVLGTPSYIARAGQGQHGHRTAVRHLRARRRPV